MSSERGMILKPVVIILVLVCLVAVMALLLNRRPAMAPYALAPDPAVGDEFLENLMHSLLKDLNETATPGIQVSIINQGQSYNLSLGTVDYDRTVEITGEHVLRVGSVTKIYTATVIMKLVEEGVLSLDTTIEKWFPEVPHAERITVQHLLNHTSGIYNYTENWFCMARTTLFPHRNWEPDEIYRYIIKGKPYFPPGEDHYYSNSNYFLLGLLAEKVTGKTYRDLVHDLILDPLRLTNTYVLPDDGQPALLIRGYDRDLIPLGPHEIRPDNRAWPSNAYAAGSIAAGAGDLTRFLQGLFAGRIISEETLAMMTEFRDFSDEDILQQSGYGLGLRRLIIEGDTLIGHTGTIPGFGAAAFYCPEKDYYIAVLGNVSFLDQPRFLSTIVKTMQAQVN